MVLFSEISSIYNLILHKVIIKYSTVRWHMAAEILIAVIFVELQRHTGQLCEIQVSLLVNEEMGSVLIFFFSVCSKFSLPFELYTYQVGQLDLRIEGSQERGTLHFPVTT